MMRALYVHPTHLYRSVSMVRQAARSRPMLGNPSAERHNWRRCGCSKGYMFLQQLLWCVLACILVFGDPIACMPSHRVLPTIPLRQAARSSTDSPSAASVLLPAGTGQPEGVYRGSGKTRDAGGARQQDSASAGRNQFSGAQMLSTERYRDPFLAQVHLHNFHAGWEEGKGSTRYGENTKNTNPATASSILETRNRAARKLPKHNERLKLTGESLIQLGTKVDSNDTPVYKDDTELFLPARSGISHTEPHWPLLPETFSDFAGDEGLDDDIAEQALPIKRDLSEKQIPAASLVEASSAADDETEQQSEKQEKDDEDEKESQAEEVEAKSQSEKESAKHGDTGEGSVSGSETTSSDTAAASKGGKETTQHEGSSSREAQDTAGEEKASAQGKPEPPAPENKEHMGNASPGEEEEELSSAKESKAADASHEEGRSERESKETPSSTVEPPGKEEAAKSKIASKLQHPEEAEKAATAIIHKKTEEEEKEEHQRHTKELAERATKLANIQRMEQEALLKLHMLGEGGPRVNVPPPSGTSPMSVQDKEQHKQLEEATKTAQNLTAHLKVQHELKQREMVLKQKEIAHLNLLKHIQVLMQSAVSSIWVKLSNVQSTLKRLLQQSIYVNKKFLRETDNRVLRPQELPQAVMSEEELKREGTLAKKQGVTPLDCPVECAPKTCDNKPSFPTHCFRYDLVAGGGGFRTCAPFADETTAACPESYTRCAMAAPVRGRRYELLTSASRNPLPQALFIRGSNMHSCLRLMAVHRETECSPTDTQSVQAALQDSQTAAKMPPPRVLEHGVIFENMQIASPGEYKLCMLQFWVPPDNLKGNVVVLGVDEIGTVIVQDPQKRKAPSSEAQAEKAAAAAELEMAGLGRESMERLPIPVENQA